MEITNQLSDIINEAFTIAISGSYEYVTPEVLLFSMCQDPEFSSVLELIDKDLTQLESELLEYMENYLRVEGIVEPSFSSSASQAIIGAQMSAQNSGNHVVDITHFIHAMYSLSDTYAIYYLLKQGIEEVDLLTAFDEARELDLEYGEYLDDDAEEDVEKASFSYAPCLNNSLEDVNPLIGREAELERTIQILCRKDKNNPLHIGEPGVGKTAITYGLVQRINEGNVPKPLEGAKVFALDLGSALAGTQYRGDFEKRIKKVLDEISKETNPIIYIDEIHNLLGAGAVGESSFDASNMLKPYLAEGKVRFIGATTFEEYKKHFEKSKSLVRRFQNVEISEPSVEETTDILAGLKERYESYHGVVYEEGVLEYAARMSAKYINERFLPDKAIDLIDEAGAYRKIHPLKKKVQVVGKDLINEVLTSICKVPVEAAQSDELQGLAHLEDNLKGKVFEQDEAIKQVVNAVKFSKAGLLEDNKPLASLLFVGPTGVGKTEIAKALANELGVKLVRFDMSEYGEKHAVAKLIGAPAGYVGYEEGGLLTESIRKTPSCVLLLDEIEKAHPDIYHVLLQVMDYATLTDNQGRKADFRNVIIIMTSNAGASQVGKTGLGFQSTDITSDIILEEVKKTFQPEFRNRLNKIVVFNGINDNMATLVAKKKLNELASMLAAKSVKFKYTKKAVDMLKSKGTSREYGAREIDRIIQGEIKPLLVDELLFGKLKNGGSCQLNNNGKEFVIKIED